MAKLTYYLTACDRQHVFCALCGNIIYKGQTVINASAPKLKDKSFCSVSCMRGFANFNQVVFNSIKHGGNKK